jgi:hypothetical protein
MPSNVSLKISINRFFAPSISTVDLTEPNVKRDSVKGIWAKRTQAGRMIVCFTCFIVVLPCDFSPNGEIVDSTELH